MAGFDAWWQPLAVLIAAGAAGAANAIAGGGSAITFPVLVLIGVPPIPANATNAVGVWPGGVAAVWSYRSRIRTIRPRTWLLAAPALAGGLVGGWLLINLPSDWFDAAAPFLVLLGAVIVAVEPAVKRWLGGGEIRGSNRALGGGIAGILGIAVYGGYFGAGMGLMLLTALALMGLRDLQRANAVKNLLAVLVKLPAIVYFVVLGKPLWHVAVIMWVGALVGGWVAGRLIQRIDADRLRWVIVAIGAVLGGFMLSR